MKSFHSLPQNLPKSLCIAHVFDVTGQIEHRMCAMPKLAVTLVNHLVGKPPSAVL